MNARDRKRLCCRALCFGPRRQLLYRICGTGAGIDAEAGGEGPREGKEERIEVSKRARQGILARGKGRIEHEEP